MAKDFEEYDDDEDDFSSAIDELDLDDWNQKFISFIFFF